MFLAAKQLGSEEAKCDLDAKKQRCEDTNRQSLLRFELFRKIKKILDLIKRNILISPLEGEKKVLSELCVLRNFREGFNLKRSCLSALVPQYLSNFFDTNHSPLTTHNSLIPDTIFSRFTSHFSRKRTAFTLAEVLITLGIIGIVAVMTLPNVINNFREKQLEAAFKKTNNVVMTALNETMAEYGLEGLAFKDLCPGYTTVSACAQANNSYFNEINSYFLSRFNIVRSTSNTFGNALDRKSIKVYNFMGKKVIEYGGMYGMGPFNTPWNSVNFLNDGSVVSALTFFYHGGSDGVALTFDTNGPYKGPNRYGYDIFIRTSGSWYKPCSKLEAGLEGGNYNGRGCYEYAQKDVNPDDKTKTYWKSLY